MKLAFLPTDAMETLFVFGRGGGCGEERRGREGLDAKEEQIEAPFDNFWQVESAQVWYDCSGKSTLNSLF